MQHQAAPTHPTHIYHLKKLSLELLKRYAPLRDAFVRRRLHMHTPGGGVAFGGGGGGGGGGGWNRDGDDAGGSAAGPALRRRGSVGSHGGMSLMSGRGREHDGGLGGGGGDAIHLDDLHSLMGDEAAAIAELGDGLLHVLSDVESMERGCDGLDKLESSHQSEDNNRLITILTGTTIVAMPATILTGYFGQNFTDMSELDAADGGFGVRTFWVALGIALPLTLLLLWRAKFFRQISY